MKMSAEPMAKAAVRPARKFWRIYSFDSSLLGAAGDVTAMLDRCVAMGFDTVLATCPDMPCRTLGNEDAAPHGHLFDDDYVAVIANACRGRKLSLYLDLAINRPPLEAIGEGNGEWFSLVDSDEAIDPRQMAECGQVAEIRFDIAAVARAATDWWAERMAKWIELGVEGFRCQRPHKVPPAVWRELMELARGVSRLDAMCRFLAWTPGLSRERLKALRGCGFDAVFSSARWWDFRADWLLDDIAASRAVAPAIAFPRAPSETQPPTDAALKAASIRALWLSAFAGDGLLIPMGFEDGAGHLDLVQDIGRVNGWAAENAANGGAIWNVAAPGSSVAALLRLNGAQATKASLLLANGDMVHAHEIDVGSLLERTPEFAQFEPLGGGAALSPDGASVHLGPGQVGIFTSRKSRPVMRANGGRKSLDAATSATRITIENIEPSVDDGRFPVKRIVGERVRVEADVFADGHDVLAVRLLWRTAEARNWVQCPMENIGNDRWQAEFSLARLGAYQFTIEAWWDDFATVVRRFTKKHAAQKPLANEFAEARVQLSAARGQAAEAEKTIIEAALAKLDSAKTDAARVGILAASELAAAMALAAPRHFVTRYPATFGIWAERREAGFASWYELFPRSQSADPNRHGNFDDVIARLPAIRDMGFDILYFPPIHPIGRINRKGRNNALTSEPGEPGSPYAIGSAEGGHTAIHPELGTLDDFRRLREVAARYGLELALDFAIQCSPDHPWLKEHPEWFKWQPDGSLHYAENPPKTYEDITNVEFYVPDAVPELWLALRDIVLFWIAEGVKIFRVDNPHTKPFPFWEWMIGDIRARHPDVIFLSEAFTAPKRMYRLAKLGFSQSYSYFTWRNDKAEFTEYLTHLSRDDVRDYFRPNFFVNTPDINPHFLQTSGRAGHLIRAALATFTSGLWGIYSGFELCEATPLPGREEYLNSEKYEIRHWDWERPGNIITEISALNRIRKANPALHSHLGITFHNAYNDQILYFARETPRRDNVLLVAINLDPFHVQEADIEIPLWEWGLPDDGAMAAEDLIHQTAFTWRGKMQHIRLDPADLPYAIWRLQPEASA